MGRGLLMLRLRLIPLSSTEPTDTPLPTPMELTPTPMDTEVLPESLPTLVPLLPSLPDPPRVLARGAPRLTPPFFMELTELPPMSPETPMAMAPADTASPRDTPVPPSPTSSSPGSTKKQRQ